MEMVSDKEIEAAIKAIEAVPIMDDTYSLSGEDAKAVARAALEAAARVRAEAAAETLIDTVSEEVWNHDASQDNCNVIDTDDLTNTGEPVAYRWRYRNSITNTWSNWIDGKGPEKPNPDDEIEEQALYTHPAPQQSGPVLPKLENCGTYFAKDNAGQWHYINHAGTWQGCPPPFPQPSGTVKPLDEDDYEEIISAAAINMRKATSGIRGQVVTVQDSIDWWVMKETERRILSALTASKPEQAVSSGWQPIETAPKDGTWILAWEDAAT